MWISLDGFISTGHRSDTLIEFIKINFDSSQMCNIKDFVLLYRCKIKILSGHKYRLEGRL